MSQPEQPTYTTMNTLHYFYRNAFPHLSLYYTSYIYVFTLLCFPSLPLPTCPLDIALSSCFSPPSIVFIFRLCPLSVFCLAACLYVFINLSPSHLAPLFYLSYYIIMFPLSPLAPLSCHYRSSLRIYMLSLSNCSSLPSIISFLCSLSSICNLASCVPNLTCIHVE